MSEAAKDIWAAMRKEASEVASSEPALASFMSEMILTHKSFGSALSFNLAMRLDSPVVGALLLRQTILEAYDDEPDLLDAALADIKAVYERDPAAKRHSTPFLYFKGFLSIQSYRVGNWLWRHGRRDLAIYLQNQISIVFGVDINPAATMGRGLMFDHATGIVIGETAVVGDDVSILQDVTLGGTGKEDGDRHPKIRSGVMIGAGARVLGNIVVGECAKIGAGSVVLRDVPAHSTVTGVPAKLVGQSRAIPSKEMDQICGI